VFSALTESQQLARWWGPEGFTIPAIDFEPRVGAAYRIAMQPPEGEPFYLRGGFSEVDPPARLAFTFVWDPATADDRETLVELDLIEQDESTEVRLSQGEFATEERRSLHDNGWGESFARLERLLAG
jgi:uncharacterized protein YndB with AHSA1/START domain